MHDRSTHIRKEVERLGFAFQLHAHCTAPTEAERIAELEAALRPFAAAVTLWVECRDDHCIVATAAVCCSITPTVGDLRRAKEVLDGQK